MSDPKNDGPELKKTGPDPEKAAASPKDADIVTNKRKQPAKRAPPKREPKDEESVQITIGDYELSVEVMADGMEEVAVAVGGMELSRARLKRKDGHLLKKLIKGKNAAKPTAAEKGKSKARHVYIEDLEEDTDDIDEEIEEVSSEGCDGTPVSNISARYLSLSRFKTARVNLARSPSDAYLRPAFARGSPMAEGWLGKAAVKFLIDSGSEICVMPTEVFEESGLFWKPAEWSMINVDGGVSWLRKVCLSAPVRIQDITIPVHIFVSEFLKGVVLLGRPFEMRARLQSFNEDDGRLICSVASLDGKERSYWVASECGERALVDRRKETDEAPLELLRE